MILWPGTRKMLAPRHLIVLALLCLCIAAGCPFRGNARIAQETRAKKPATARRNAEKQFDAAYRQVVNGEHENAIRGLWRFIRRMEKDGTTDAPHLGQAYFWLGHCYEELARKLQAAQAYRTVIQRFPKSPYASRAQKRYDELSDSAAP